MPYGLQARQVPLALGDPNDAEGDPGEATPPFESLKETAPRGLREPEVAIWQAVTTGQVARCTEHEPQRPGAQPVRAAFLVWLLTSDEIPRHVLRILGASIEGHLDLEGRTVQCPIDFHRCRFSESIKVDQAKLSRLSLIDCDVPALEARQLQTTGDLSLSRSRVRWVGLLGARIGGQLDLAHAELSNSRGEALTADGASVGQDVICRGTKAHGGITLVNAAIAGSIDLSAAKIYPRGIRASKVLIGADLRTDESTAVSGTLALTGASIGGLLQLSDAALRTRRGSAVDLEGANVHNLALPTRLPPRGPVELTRSRIGHFDDAWGSVRYRARINGLIYETLSERAGGLQVRLGWLRAALPEEGAPAAEPEKPAYVPQAYEQLASVYRRDGCEHHARRVLMEKERERYRRPDHAHPAQRALSRVWGTAFGLLGFGYRWYRGLIALGILYLADWYIFEHTAHDMVPVAPTSHPPPFSAPLYALEAIAPLVDFGQKALWASTRTAAWAYVVSVVLSWTVLTVTVASLTQRYVRR